MRGKHKSVSEIEIMNPDQMEEINDDREFWEILENHYIEAQREFDSAIPDELRGGETFPLI